MVNGGFQSSRCGRERILLHARTTPAGEIIPDGKGRMNGIERGSNCIGISHRYNISGDTVFNEVGRAANLIGYYARQS